LGVGEGMDFDLIGGTFFAREAVLENERGDANAVEPFGDVGAFGVDG